MKRPHLLDFYGKTLHKRLSSALSSPGLDSQITYWHPDNVLAGSNFFTYDYVNSLLTIIKPTEYEEEFKNFIELYSEDTENPYFKITDGFFMGVGISDEPTHRIDLSGNIRLRITLEINSPALIQQLGGDPIQEVSVAATEFNDELGHILSNSLFIPETLNVGLLESPTRYAFRVDENGDMVTIKDVTYSWPSSAPPEAGVYYLNNNGTGILTWEELVIPDPGLQGSGEENEIAVWGVDDTLLGDNMFTFNPTTNNLYLYGFALFENCLENILITRLTSEEVITVKYPLKVSNLGNSSFDDGGGVGIAFEAGTQETNSLLGKISAEREGDNDYYGLFKILVENGNGVWVTGLQIHHDGVIETVDGKFKIDANGDIKKLKNLDYTFPSAHAAGVLTNNGTGTLTWASAGGANHNLLDGSVHPDTIAGTVTRGGLVIGQLDGTVKWKLKTLGTLGQVLYSDGTDALWAQLDHTKLSSIGSNTHAQIDTFIASKAAASGLASLDASSLVVQNPANATATPTANKIPIANISGSLNGWISGYNGEIRILDGDAVTTHVLSVEGGRIADYQTE